MTTRIYYEILDVEQDADEDEIQRARRNLTREVHPDISDISNASEYMSDLNTIKKVLSTQRQEYDASSSDEEFIRHNPHAKLKADWESFLDGTRRQTGPSESETQDDRSNESEKGSEENDEESEVNSDRRSQEYRKTKRERNSERFSKDSSPNNRFTTEQRTDSEPEERSSNTHERVADDSDLNQGVDRTFDDPSTYVGDYPPDWDARRRAVYQRDKYTCGNCGVQTGPLNPDADIPVHAHHIVPLSKGGTNALENITTLCESCHNLAHDHDITQDVYPSDGTQGEAIDFPLKRYLILGALCIFTPIWYMYGIIQFLELLSLDGGSVAASLFGLAGMVAHLEFARRNLKLVAVVNGLIAAFALYGFVDGTFTQDAISTAAGVIIIVAMVFPIGLSYFLNKKYNSK